LRRPVHGARFAAVLLSVLGFAVTAPAASGYDPVQRCLDLVQLNLVGKIAPAEIKSALENQIAYCERKSAEEKGQTFQFGCRMVKKEDYCLNANVQMLKIASLPNMPSRH